MQNVQQNFRLKAKSGFAHQNPTLETAPTVRLSGKKMQEHIHNTLQFKIACSRISSQNAERGYLQTTQQTNQNDKSRWGKICDGLLACVTSAEVNWHIRNNSVSPLPSVQFKLEKKNAAPIYREEMECEECGQKCKGTGNLNRHMKRKHSNLLSKINRPAKAKSKVRRKTVSRAREVAEIKKKKKNKTNPKNDTGSHPNTNQSTSNGSWSTSSNRSTSSRLNINSYSFF